MKPIKIKGETIYISSTNFVTKVEKHIMKYQHSIENGNVWIVLPTLTDNNKNL